MAGILRYSRAICARSFHLGSKRPCLSGTSVEVGGGDERMEVLSFCTSSFVIKDTIIDRLYVLKTVGKQKELSSNGAVRYVYNKIDSISQNFSSKLACNDLSLKDRGRPRPLVVLLDGLTRRSQIFLRPDRTLASTGARCRSGSAGSGKKRGGRRRRSWASRAREELPLLLHTHALFHGIRR
jgi:hypothetical protein